MAKRLLLSLALAAALPALVGGCATTPTSNGTQPSMLDKVGGSVKSGTQSVTAFLKPKPAWAKTETSDEPTGKPSPTLFVAAAQMSERSGDFASAEAQYNKALELDANHLGALVGYAHLQDRQSNFEGAVAFYKKALKKHSKEASVHNDLGLCYHRRGMLPEADKSLQAAIALQPNKKLYRDNLAAVLVEQNKPNEALVQLTAAHGEAVGNYNLGYLLVQRKNNGAALGHFRRAAELDPALEAAQQWIATLSAPGTPNGFQWNGPAIADGRAMSPPTFAATTSANYVALPATQHPGMPPQLVQASGRDSSAPQAPPQVRSQAEAQGVQFPQSRRPSDSGVDAMPPLPGPAN